MLVSVIIPNYNHAQYLDIRLQSILKQTYKCFEIIILDDCSTDNSRDVIEKYRGKDNIRHIEYNQVNSGRVFQQWRKGVELSKGDLIWIAESDDSCDEMFLERMVSNFRDENVVLSFSRSYRFTDDGEKRIYPSQLAMNTSFKMGGIEFIKRYLILKNFVVNASSVVFRKSAFFSISLDYTEYKGCGDWLFWIYLSEKGCVCYDRSPLNYFRKHEANTTSNLDCSGVNPVEVSKIYSYLNESGYLNWFNKKRFRISKLAMYLYDIQYDNKHIRGEVVRKWNASKSEIMLASIYRQLRLFYQKILRFH